MTYQLLDSFIRTLPIWICSFLLLTVGLPIYLITGFDTPFEAIYFVLVWTCCLQLLRLLRASKSLLLFPKVRSTLIICSNPVLLTSGFGTVYFWIRTLPGKTTIEQVVTNFRKSSTLAAAFISISEDHDLKSHIGAGDLACVILDAGILCLGLKMFEYRRELAASFYSVMSTCSVVATAGIFFNVAVARRMGLDTEEALAFAAKSVTIALGVPVIQKVDGSTTLMSALCIFSGIIFQMAGNFLFRVLRIDDRRCRARSESGRRSGSGSGSDTEKTVPDFYEGRDTSTAEDEVKLLAAGVTVGINAAAMGTAHLIERDSTAVAYAALSMTIFGGMTVALTALPGVSELLIFLASR